MSRSQGRLITVERPSLVLEKSPRMQFDGAISRRLRHHPIDEAVLENPLILITDRILELQDISRPSRRPSSRHRPQSSGTHGELVPRCRNKLRSRLVLAVRRRASASPQEILRDIAGLTGGTWSSKRSCASSLVTVEDSGRPSRRCDKAHAVSRAGSPYPIKALMADHARSGHTSDTQGSSRIVVPSCPVASR